MDSGTPPQVEEVFSDSKPQPKPRRKILGLILGLMILFCGVIFAATYYVYFHFLDPISLKAQIEEKASMALGIQVGIEKISLDFPTVKISKVVIGSASESTLPFILIDSGAATPDIWSLLQGNIIFEDIAISSVTVKLTRTASGVVLPTKKLPDSNESTTRSVTSPKTAVFPLKNVSASQVSLILDDQSVNRAINVTLSKVDFSAPSAATKYPFAAEARFDQMISISVKGNVSWPNSFEAEIICSDIITSKLLTWLPKQIFLPEGITNPKIKAKVNYNFQGALSVPELSFEAEPELKIKGSLMATSLAPFTGSATVNVQSIPVKQIWGWAQPFLLARAPSVAFLSGRAGLEAKIGISESALTNDHYILHLEKISASYKDFPLNLDYLNGLLSFSTIERELSWENLSVRLASLNLSSSGGRLFLPSASDQVSTKVNEGLVAQLQRCKGRLDLSISLDTGETFKALISKIPSSWAYINPTGNLAFKGGLNIVCGDSTADGELSATDLKFTPLSALFPVEISKAVLNLEKLGLKTGKVLIRKMEGTLLGMPLRFEGDIAMKPEPQFNIQALTTKEGIELSQLQANLPIEHELFKKHAKLSGRALVKAKITGTLSKPMVEGSLNFTDAAFSIPEKKISITDINGLVQADLNSANFSEIKALVANGRLKVQGSIKNFLQPTIQASGTISDINLSEVKKFLEINFPTFPKDLNFSGKADLELLLSGSATSPKVNGTTLLKGVDFTHPSALRELKMISGPLKFSNNRLTTEELNMNWGSSSFKLKGDVEDLALFNMNFEYFVSPLDLTDIGAFFLAQTGYKLSGKGTGKGKIFGPIEKLVVDGILDAPTGQIEAPISKKNPATFKFPFTELKAPFHFTGGIFKISKASAKVFEGLLETSGQVFVTEKPIRFAFNSSGNALNVQQFLRTNTSLKDALSGNLDFTFSSSGNTTGLNSLTGDSTITMKSGHYKAPPVAAYIFSALSAPQLSSGDLKGLSGKFIFKDGEMNSDDLIFKSSYGSMGYKGIVGLDTSLKGQANLELTKDACQKSSLLKKLIRNEATLSIPVGVKGSVLSPSIDLRIDQLLKNAAEKKVKEALINAVMGGSLNSSNTSSDTASISSSLPLKDIGKKITKQIEKNVAKEIGKLLGSPEPTSTASSTPNSQNATEPATVAAPTPPSEPKEPVEPESPEKQIKKNIKKIGKDLKKIFKF